MKLGEVLVAQGKLQKEQVDQALAFQERTGSIFGLALICLGFAKPEDIEQALVSVRRCTIATALGLNLSACGGNWSNYNYGPADWLDERGYGSWDTMYNYTRLIEPEIKVHYVDDLGEACGSQYVKGCARVTASKCDIWVGHTPPAGTLEHEMRHCHGWTHSQLDFSGWAMYDKDAKARELRRSKRWYPMQTLIAGTNQESTMRCQ